ncbi:hypothetical protein B0H10DRAFT_2164537 [Mycena sp. CBHHK59/15]|nr:hypothetical protein B0H10DRAFT_2164537 [Mycena sp. CBHHK59/15]
MEGQLRELIPFLRDRNPQVRQTALSNLLPQTVKNAPHRNIFFSGLQSGGLQKRKENDVVRDIKLLCRDQLSVAHDAFRALVNLSDSPMLVATLSEPAFLTFIVSYIINPQSILADLASMLFRCATVLSLKIDIIPEPTFPNSFYPPQSRCGTAVAPAPYPAGDARLVLALPLLLDAFVQGAQTDDSADGNLHFQASVFANLTTSPAGRNFFLGPRSPSVLEPDGAPEYPLAKLLAFTEHKELYVEEANCVFHAPGHQAFLSPDSTNVSVPPSTSTAPGIDALQYVLLPLAGPEEFDFEDQEKLPDALQFLPPTKVREPDAAIRLMHVETLLLLCHTRWGRDFLREHGVYEIVRATHENETVDKISEHIERLVNLLKGDEPDVEPSTDLSDKHETHEELTASASVSDDEDSRIDEV